MAFCQRILKPNTLIALLIGGAFLIRLYFILHHQGFWGVDGGAYLLSRNAVLGDEPTGTDFPRPPFAPGWLLVPFTYLFGDNWGRRYFSLLLSFAVLPPYLMLIKRLLTPWQRVAAVFLLLADWNLAEMFTAGALPMIGFAFMTLGAWALIVLKDRWDWRVAICLGLAIPSIPYTNQTSVALAAIFFPAFVLGLGLTKTFFKRLLLPVGAGLTLALTAWPWYLAVAPGSPQLRYPGALVTFYSIANAGWEQLALALAIAVLLLAVFKVKGPMRGFAFIVLALAILVPLRSYDESIQNIFYRTRYLIMVPANICLVWLFARWLKVQNLSWRIVGKTMAICLIPLVIIGYVFQLHAETKLGRMVTPETAEAIAWVKEQPERGTILTNSYSLSLYVAALTKQKTAWVQVWDPPPAYAEQHRAASVVFGWASGDPLAAAKELNATYILADLLWPAWDKQVAEKTAGLGSAYAFVEHLSPFADADLGFIWNLTRDIDPWPTTEKATWLELVWEKGNTKVWKIIDT